MLPSMRRMAVVQAYAAVFVIVLIAGSEWAGLRFHHWWSYPLQSARLEAARRDPWTVLALGSSQVASGVLPREMERALAVAGRPEERVHSLGLGGALAFTQAMAYRRVSPGHRPRAVVIGLAPRDLTGTWQQATLSPHVHASLDEALVLARADPGRRWTLPWDVMSRDLGMLPQAGFALLPSSRREVEAWRERGGSPWTPGGYEGYPVETLRSRVGDRLSLLRVQMADRAPDAVAWIEVLLTAVRAGGGVPVFLVLPRSDWGEADDPEPWRRFDEDIDRLGRRTGTAVLHARTLDPELRRRVYYLDYIDHLTHAGAERLSWVLGQAVGALLGGRAPEEGLRPSARGPDLPSDVLPCVATAGPEAQRQLLVGWWAAELGGRWTQPSATAEMPWPGDGGRLRIEGYNWERRPLRFQVQVDGRLALETTVGYGEFQVAATLPFTPDERPTLVRIERRPPFLPAELGLPDRRELGVFVTRLCLEAAPPQPSGFVGGVGP